MFALCLFCDIFLIHFVQDIRCIKDVQDIAEGSNIKSIMRDLKVNLLTLRYTNLRFYSCNLNINKKEMFVLTFIGCKID